MIFVFSMVNNQSNWICVLLAKLIGHWQQTNVSAWFNSYNGMQLNYISCPPNVNTIYLMDDLSLWNKALLLKVLTLTLHQGHGRATVTFKPQMLCLETYAGCIKVPWCDTWEYSSWGLYLLTAGPHLTHGAYLLSDLLSHQRSFECVFRPGCPPALLLRAYFPFWFLSYFMENIGTIDRKMCSSISKYKGFCSLYSQKKDEVIYIYKTKMSTVLVGCFQKV